MSTSSSTPARLVGAGGSSTRVHGLDRVALVKRRASLDGGVERHAQREQVARRPEVLAHGALGRDEVRRAEHHARGGELHVGGHPGDAEVGEHAPAVGADQHVGRLDVAVQHAVGVGDLQRAEQRDADLRDRARRDRAVFDHHVGEAARVEQLHDDPRSTAFLDDVVDLHHGRVLQRRGGARFAHGALVHRVTVAGRETRRQHDLLDRDVATQQDVVRAPDRAHAAVADRRPERVAAADRGSGSGAAARDSGPRGSRTVGSGGGGAAPRRNLSH